MKKFLLSLIPWYGLWFGLTLIVYSYTGEWPNAWALLGFFCFGVVWGSRDLL